MTITTDPTIALNPFEAEGDGHDHHDHDPRLFLDVNDASVDPQGGTTAPNGKPIFTADQAADQISRPDVSWLPGTGNAPQTDDVANVINFGFHLDLQSLEDNGYVFTYQGTEYGAEEYFNFAAFNGAQQAATRQAIGYWDDVLAVSFKETDSDDADINFGNLADAPQTQAYAYYPTDELYGIPEIDAQVGGVAGDVWVSASQRSNFQLAPGGYGLNTLVHEIGHTLGLAHPGAYNYDPDVPLSYANSAEYYQDVRNYSIMSYWNPRDIGARDFNWNVMSIAYGATPMVHDILSAQAVYGADMTTRTGDTVYGFNSNAGRAAFDFVENEAPTVAIWDAGGNDTLDVSGYATNQIIDLNPGSLSSIGGVTLAEAQARLSFEAVNANRAELGYAPIARATYDANMAALAANPELGRLTDNVGIAYGAWIENAVGGSGNDRIHANAVANRIDGGAGQDVVVYDTADKGVIVDLNFGITAGGAAGDRLTSIEGVIGSAHNDIVTGNNADNLIGGGAGGRDILYGGGGVDTATYAESATGVSVDLFVFGSGVSTDGDVLLGFENLTGSAFDDKLDGSLESNVLSGLAGNDVLNGDWGDDTLLGGLGADTLDGGWGDDRLDGGAGADRLTGGLGRDVFAFGVADDAVDVVTDFSKLFDKIDLTAIDAVVGTAVNDAFNWIGDAVFGGVAGQLRFAGNQLEGDTDGDKLADLIVQFAQPVTLTPAEILA